jgi:hydrogenase nickel incorporation protein HypA/HybF
MHEFSICQTLVKAILSELKKLDPPNPKLIKASVVVGRLRQIIPETLKFAYEMLTKETTIAGSEIEIIGAPILAKCPKCGWKGEIKENNFRCVKCGSGEIQLSGGMELYLNNLTVKKQNEILR